MNEFTVTVNGTQHHWVSPDPPMLRSALDKVVNMRLSKNWEQAASLCAGSKKAIDVGACIGSLAYLLDELVPGMEIYAYEPYSENYECLVQNTAHMPNVHTYNFGLSNVEQDATVAMPTVDQKEYMNYWSGDNVGIISVYGDSEHRREKVHLKVLDDLHDTTDILKVDAEGHDYQIMLGAEKLVMNSRPILMLEFVPSNFVLSGNSLEDYLRLLFNKYKYIPVGGDWGNMFWMPKEQAPEHLKYAKYSFTPNVDEFTNGYTVGIELPE